MAEGAFRFRRDLPASNVEADGVLYVEVSDPRSGNSFRFYDFEYAVALKLDGRPLDTVAADLRDSAELELTVDQLAAFADQLGSLGFVEQAPSFFPPLAEDESGEWSSPAIRGRGPNATPPAELIRPAATPAPSAGEQADEGLPSDDLIADLIDDRADDPTPGPPPAMADLGPSWKGAIAPDRSGNGAGNGDSVRSPAPSARSLSEHTFTSYPPEARPTERTPEPDAAATDLALPQLGAGARTPTPTLTPAPLSTPAGKSLLAAPTPEPIRTGVPGAASPFARDEGPGTADATLADTRRPSLEELEAPAESAPQLEAALRGATEGLGDLSAILGDPGAEKTPSSEDLEAARVPATGFGQGTSPPPAAPASLSASPPADTGAAAAPPASAIPADRRELPTQRLRAVSDLSAEEPGEARLDADVPGSLSAPPPGIPGVPGMGVAFPLPGSIAATRVPPVGPTAAPAAGLPRPPVDSPSLRPAEVGRLPSWVAYAALGTLAAVVIAVVAYKYNDVGEVAPITVRTIVPVPSTVYRFWAETGTVERAEGTAFAFASEGKVAELPPTGTRFGGGDVVGLLESGKRFRAELNHNRERLSFYQQKLETETRANNRPEIRQAEIKIIEKKRLVDEAQASLSKHAIVALQAGEVAEALVAPGEAVKEGQPALRVKGTTYRATFTMSAADAVKARQLGFCRVEIEGKPIDCSLSAEGGDESRVVIDLPNDAVVAAGKSVRLAKDRLDGVFPLPASVVERVGDSDRLFVVVGGGPGVPTRAEPRVIAVADRTASEVVVSQGIDVGDRVIVDRPTGLKAEDRVIVAEER
jgi:hypothetical protein